MVRFFVLFALCASLGCASKQAAPPPSTAAAPAAAPSSAAPEAAGDQAAQSGVERIYELDHAERGPAMGPATAKVTLDVCSDFQCPFCARLVPTLKEVEENYGELVRVRWRN